MANLQNIRRRIKSVKNIQKITNAMDMIARSRFNYSRDALISYLPYVDKTREIIQRVMTQMVGLEDDSPFICTRQQLAKLQQKISIDNRKFLFLVISSDKGLAGAYSSNVIKEAHDTIEYDGNIDSAKNFGVENFHIKNFDAIKNIKVSKTPNRQSKQFSTTHRYTSATMDRPSGGADVTANLDVAPVYHDSDFIDGVELITVGRKATNHFKQRGLNFQNIITALLTRPILICYHNDN